MFLSASPELDKPVSAIQVGASFCGKDLTIEMEDSIYVENMYLFGARAFAKEFVSAKKLIDRLNPFQLLSALTLTARLTDGGAFPAVGFRNREKEQDTSYKQVTL